jgi:hypothetical protein
LRGRKIFGWREGRLERRWFCVDEREMGRCMGLLEMMGENNDRGEMLVLRVSGRSLRGWRIVKGYMARGRPVSFWQRGLERRLRLGIRKGYGF